MQSHNSLPLNSSVQNRDTDVAYVGVTAELSTIVAMLVTGIALDLTKAF